MEMWNMCPLFKGACRAASSRKKEARFSSRVIQQASGLPAILPTFIFLGVGIGNVVIAFMCISYFCVIVTWGKQRRKQLK